MAVPVLIMGLNETTEFRLPRGAIYQELIEMAEEAKKTKEAKDTKEAKAEKTSKVSAKVKKLETR